METKIYKVTIGGEEKTISIVSNEDGTYNATLDGVQYSCRYIEQSKNGNSRTYTMQVAGVEKLTKVTKDTTVDNRYTVELPSDTYTCDLREVFDEQLEIINSSGTQITSSLVGDTHVYVLSSADTYDITSTTGLSTNCRIVIENGDVTLNINNININNSELDVDAPVFNFNFTNSTKVPKINFSGINTITPSNVTTAVILSNHSLEISGNTDSKFIIPSKEESIIYTYENLTIKGNITFNLQSVGAGTATITAVDTLTISDNVKINIQSDFEAISCTDLIAEDNAFILATALEANNIGTVTKNGGYVEFTNSIVSSDSSVTITNGDGDVIAAIMSLDREANYIFCLADTITTGLEYNLLVNETNIETTTAI